MFLLLFFVFSIQFFTFWIFEPLTFFAEYIFQIRLLPIIALLVLIVFFSAKNVEQN